MPEQNEINLRKILEAERERLYQIPGVHGLGLGPKIVAGKITHEPAIQILVFKKKRPADIPADQMIPPQIANIKTDVIQAGPVELLLGSEECPEINPDSGSYRPLVGGIQIQPDGGNFHNISYSGRGTLGCIVRTRGSSPKDMLLTNEHVLYSGTASGPSCSGCTDGSRVGQPTRASSEKIGNVLSGKKTLLVDGGLATLKAGTQWKAEILDIGRIMGKEEVTTAMLLARTTPYRVKKRGAKTRLTQGTITSAETEGHATEAFGGRDYNNSLRIFPDDYMSGNKCFGSSGDSGSLVVNDANKAVGLLFGSLEITIGTSTFRAGLACPIDPVLDQLQVDLVHSQPAGHVFTVTEAFVASEVGSESPALASMTVEEHVHLRESVQKDIFQLPNGSSYVSLFKTHENEIRHLVNTNRRVATIWHRNGGPSILHQLIRSVQDSTRKLPQTLTNGEWNECVTKIFDGFKKYGSYALKKDIDHVKDFLCTIGGLTYDQVVSNLGIVLAQADFTTNLRN